eukprot:CAMPEP_0176178896 /NCGR_PEP_ID=MMETSP0120_2-20121206/91660_1 /TAXON_ID=160619 /ORGANISM="Kryptoperidinium foliaceum, Strain CCMP 1326" /LENGTH=59 /DNA_ID=CAMNT_0017517053 /DNA_START=47 /DNA_END=226 /DNA_ORIENTATION=+
MESVKESSADASLSAAACGSYFVAGREQSLRAATATSMVAWVSAVRCTLASDSRDERRS